MQADSKRQTFRKDMRRKQIQKIFHNIRKQRISKVYRFATISQEKKTQMIGYIYKTMDSLSDSKKYSQYQKILSILEDCQQKVNYNPQYISSCFNDYLSKLGDKVINLVKKDIPIQVLGQIDDEEAPQQISLEGNIPQEINIAKKSLQICVKLQLQKFDQKAAILILKALWNIISQQYYLPNKNYPQTNHFTTSIMLNFCLSLTHLLENPQNHRIIKKHLKQMGFPQTLSRIIDVYDDLAMDDFGVILNLIFMFCRKNGQLQFLEETGIYIIGIESACYDKFCAFCLYFITKNIHSNIYNALSALEQIFNDASYLIDNCSFSSIEMILNLILDENRQISAKALEVFNTIVFYSQSVADDLVEKTNVISIIHERLRRESLLPKHDPDTNSSIQRCTNIICDLLLTKSRLVKEKMFEHPIWQFLYECISENHPLLSTVVVFKYFFPAFSRKKTILILPSFLEAISNLNLNDDTNQSIREAKKTIKNLYDFSLQFWDEETYNQFRDMINMYNLSNVIDEIN